MAWVKLADGFLFHPKARAAGKDGRALFIAGLCWAASSETRGVVPTRDLPLLATAAEVKPAISKLLVEVGLWEVHPEGWLIHDYHEYNPTPEAIEDRRRKRAEAGRKGGQRSRPPGSKREANASNGAEANDEADSEQYTNPYSSSCSAEGSHPPTTSSGCDPTAEDDEGELTGWHERAVAACDVLGDEAHQNRVNAGAVTNIAGHRAACRRSARSDHLERAQYLCREWPSQPPEKIAEAILKEAQEDVGNGHRAPSELDTFGLYEAAEARRQEQLADGPQESNRDLNLTGAAAARAALRQVTADREARESA